MPCFNCQLARAVDRRIGRAPQATGYAQAY